MDSATESCVTDIIQETLCEALDFVRESLLVAISAREEEKEQRLNVAWLKLKCTICRTRSRFQHLQVGNGRETQLSYNVVLLLLVIGRTVGHCVFSRLLIVCICIVFVHTE